MISDQLRSILNDRQMTMEELSCRAQIPLETIRNLVYQKAKNPRLNTILSLCKALNISVESIVSNAPEESERQLLEYYNNCSSHGKYLIRLIASIESDMGTDTGNVSQRHEIPCLLPLDEMTDGSPYNIRSVNQIPTSCRDASLAIQMTTGDFTPVYCRDDILLLASRFPREGENALFLYKRHIYFRKFHNPCDDDYVLCPICGENVPLRFKSMNSCRLLGTCIEIIR